MSTKQKRRSPGGIDPDRLYSFEELGQISGLGFSRIKHRVESGELGYVQIGRERGRMVRGRQYLDWLEENTVEAGG